MDCILIMLVFMFAAWLVWYIHLKRIIRILNQLDKVVRGSKNKDWACGVEYAIEQIERTVGVWVRKSDSK